MTVTVPEWLGSLKEWRDAMGISQAEAAKLLWCGERRIQGLEAGKVEGFKQLTGPERVFMAVKLAALVQREHDRRLEMVGGA